MKVPEPRKLKSGNYFIQLRLNGVSIPITASTSTECRQQAALIKAEYNAGKRIITKTAKEYTLKEACEKYINKYKNALSPSTVRGYTIYKDQRFKEYQDKMLADINWQEMINDELTDKSEKTVRNAWGLVHAALDDLHFPIPDIKLAKAPIKEIAFLQPEEILPFCDAVKGRSYEIPALLELHGLRLSEVRGLTWDNVDLKKGVITIRGARVRGVDGEVMKKTNKNQTSTRQVPIMIPQLTDALQAVPNKTDRVVKTAPNALLDDVKRACERAGVTVVTNHGLRHSFASLGYHLKLSERQLMQWGGWKDYQTMHKIYIRLAACDESDAKTKMQKFFTPNANENANGAETSAE